MTRSLLVPVIVALSFCAAHGQQITVYSAGNVTMGGTRQLTAYVPLSPSTVVWSVNGVMGGDSTFGKVTSAGLYQAPAVIPSSNVVMVGATSTAYPTKSDTVNLTITQPPVQLWSITPKSVPAGNFSILLNGSNFHADSIVKFGEVALSTRWVSSTGLKASGVALGEQAGKDVAVTVVNPGLGGTTSSAVPLRVTAESAILVSVSPATVTLGLAANRQFSATVSGSSNSFVVWSVNGVPGGSAAFGTISPSGLYLAPATPPSSSSNVYVQATSAVRSTAVGTAVVTLQSPPPATVTVVVSPLSAQVMAGSTQQFSAQTSGSTNTAVTWSVNGVTGGNGAVGTISTTGLLVAPATVPNPPTITVRATSVVNSSATSTASVVILAPGGGAGQGTGNLAAARLLEQAAFGPTPADVSRVKLLGANAWLNEQFSLPESPIENPGGMGVGLVQSQYLNRLAQAPDQLRQRVAYALSQIIVISLNKNIYPDEIVPYLQILSRNAFGNYRTLLGEIAGSSQMGKYLDLANSNKPTPGSAANENFARELMQLFTIGLYQLNADGSYQLDSLGNPISAYNQATVQQVALALTGWTFPGPGNNNWENFSGPLEPREINHDPRQKNFIGVTLPAGQLAAADMAGTLNGLFNHPNIGPFLATRLIRALVMSNPSPAYVQRVARIFDDNGSGVRGDLRAVVSAILLDADARDDLPSANGGRLKDAIYHTVALVRALGGTISAGNGQSWYLGQLGQRPLAPPSVFGFYSPLFRIPRSTLSGPEFQIYGPTEAVLRGNLFWQILSNPGSDFLVDITSFVGVATDPIALIDAVDQALLYGRMPIAMRQSLASAISAQGDSRSKALTALYLTSLSGLYAVQY